MQALRYLDLAVLAVALPVFLVAGLPLLGWGVVAAVWLALRAVHDLLFRRAAAAQDPRRSTALMAVGMFGRLRSSRPARSSARRACPQPCSRSSSSRAISWG
jgi:hypothetical protein